MPKEFSPEEKLLNLIRKKKAANPPPAQPERPVPLASKPNRDLPSYLDLTNIIKLEHIKTINMVLFSSLIIIILYLAIDIFIFSSDAVPAQAYTAKDPSHAVRQEKREIEPLSHYSKDINAKDLFRPLAQNDAGGTKPVVPAEDVMSNLSLLGVVSGENPQAIIENKKQKKTIFLKKGQTSGDLKLKEIEADSVTVIYRGEEYTLTM
ncbi:MAG: hypothetical protein HQ575_02260 [Candidatus Omnitrophica bacterium]|nr:hypothetical protein [Candidatus Omnitrophota bacterium]